MASNSIAFCGKSEVITPNLKRAASQLRGALENSSSKMPEKSSIITEIIPPQGHYSFKTVFRPDDGGDIISLTHITSNENPYAFNNINDFAEEAQDNMQSHNEKFDIKSFLKDTMVLLDSNIEKLYVKMKKPSEIPGQKPQKISGEIKYLDKEQAYQLPDGSKINIKV